MQSANSKSIFILLTRYLDRFSRAFRLLTFTQYTHASINLEGSDEYYSFNTKGFRMERPFRSKNPQKTEAPCALLQLTVSEDIFEAVRSLLEDFKAEGEQYHYSFLGVLLCILGLPPKRKRYYFCSQFVSEILTLSGAAHPHKPHSLYLPDVFIMEPWLTLRYQGTLRHLSEAMEMCSTAMYFT